MTNQVAKIKRVFGGKPLIQWCAGSEDIADGTVLIADNTGPGTPYARWIWTMNELDKRFPHPKPWDSTKMPEQYLLEAIDDLIDEHYKLLRYTKRDQKR